jgi:hypothetical protein
VDERCKLPMARLGAKANAMRANLQEVRLWKRQLGREEVADSRREMREFGDAGLYAYWTLEEARGMYVMDWMQAFPRSRLHGPGVSWDLLKSSGPREPGPPDWNDAPTPSVRERDVCKVALRKLRMAQRARVRMEPQRCECGQTHPNHTWLGIHRQYDCVLRRVSCRNPGCGAKVEWKELEFHEGFQVRRETCGGCGGCGRGMWRVREGMRGAGCWGG